MARKLDKSKPYGTIHGDQSPALRGACFMQDNLYFDSLGNEILDEEQQQEEQAAGTTKHKGGRKPKEEGAAAADPAGDQVSSQLAQQ